MAIRFTDNRNAITSAPVDYNDPKNAWLKNVAAPGTISDGVLGFLGVQPQQYDQARSLIAAGVPSLNNADRLSGIDSTTAAKMQAASAAGVTHLNGDALVPGGPGTQNQNAPMFYQPTSGTFGGVQNEDRSNTFWNQIAQQSQQQFNQNQALGGSLVAGVGSKTPQLGQGIGGMLSGMQGGSNAPQLGQGIGGMLSGMQGGSNVNIPSMANVPSFTMPKQPSFDPTKYQANPYLGQMGQSITSQVTENLLRNVMPGIRSGAQAAGGFGGSRQGVVEANALKDASKSISDSLTGMYFGDYTNAMNRNLQQYGMDQNFNMGLGQLGLNAQNAARNYNLGVGQLALGNQNSNQNYNLGLGQLALGNQNSLQNYNLGVGQLALGNQNSLQNFYSTNRGQDLQQTQLGASLMNMGNQGFLSQGQGLYGLGQTQQQAPWNAINNANAGLGQWSGYGTTTSANQGGGAQGTLGGMMAGGQLGSLWGGAGVSSPVSTPQPLNANYSLSTGGGLGLQAPSGWGV